MSVKINLGAWSSVFAVPSRVVDEGLKFSDGVKLKVLLYVLRNSDRDLSFEKISSATGVNVTDIPEALDYWVNMEILSKNDNVYSPTEIKFSAIKAVKADDYIAEAAESKSAAPSYSDKKEEASIFPPQTADEKAENKHRFAVTKPQKPDYVFTTQRLAVDEELKFLVGEAQAALGKVLSNSDIATLLMLKDTCGLPLDVILMLIQYCISIDKPNLRAIEKIGIGWADDGIYSVEAADNKIRMARQQSVSFSVVSSAFGMKNVGSPTKKQLDYSSKWVGEWKFSPEMLREAYERCVDTQGVMKLNYIDGILKRWHANNIKSPEELKAFEQSGKSKSAEKQTPSYDIDELDKINTLDFLK